MRTLVGTLPPDPEPLPHPRQRLGLFAFLRQVRAECSRIVAPSPTELLVYAGAALICVITMTAFVFALDVLLVKGLFRLFG